MRERDNEREREREIERERERERLRERERERLRERERKLWKKALFDSGKIINRPIYNYSILNI